MAHRDHQDRIAAADARAKERARDGLVAELSASIDHWTREARTNCPSRSTAVYCEEIARLKGLMLAAIKGES